MSEAKKDTKAEKRVQDLKYTMGSSEIIAAFLKSKGVAFRGLWTKRLTKTGVTPAQRKHLEILLKEFVEDQKLLLQGLSKNDHSSAPEAAAGVAAAGAGPGDGAPSKNAHSSTG